MTRLPSWRAGVRLDTLWYAPVVVIIASLLLVATASCRGPDGGEVSGVLIDVQSSQILHAEALTVRDERGQVFRFIVSPEVATNPDHPNSASHLRQHMTAGDPVIVTFRSTPDGPIAVRVRDAA